MDNLTKFFNNKAQNFSNNYHKLKNFKAQRFYQKFEVETFTGFNSFIK